MRSTTSKPTLCRVPTYLRPGLPKPTTSFIQGPVSFSHCSRGPTPARSQALLLLLFGWFFLSLLGLALLDDFRFRRRRTRRRRSRIRRNRLFLGPQRYDVHDHHLGVARRL